MRVLTKIEAQMCVLSRSPTSATATKREMSIAGKTRQKKIEKVSGDEGREKKRCGERGGERERERETLDNNMRERASEVER